LIALVVALLAADLIMPSFNTFTEKSLSLDNSLLNPLISFTLLGITLLVGLLAGIYPAFFLSTFKPVEVMYGRIFRGRNKGLPRKMLIAFQFFISFSLIFATLVVFLQLGHMRSAELGFEKDNLLLIPVMEENARMDYEVFRNEVIQYPGVIEVSNSMFPTGLGAAMDIMKVEDSAGFSQELIGLNFVYHHYIKLMGMQVILGRDFDESSRTDAEQAVLINETAAKKLGWQEDPIGKRLSLSADYDHFYRVTGVIRDFHYAPLHEEIGPMVYFLMEEPQQSMAIRISGYERKNTIDEIQKAWEGLFPDIPVSYVFLDHELNASYLKEDKLGKLMGTFTLISILIGLLGLFSLSSYLTEQYTREIAIRKVFGAGIFSIIYRLSRQYLMFVLTGSIIAMPFCWIFMQSWLDNFAYRIELQAWWFLLIMIVVALVAEMTVIYQSVITAVRNPSDSLRHE
jgi:putative ABC transport system permease protein